MKSFVTAAVITVAATFGLGPAEARAEEPSDVRVVDTKVKELIKALQLMDERIRALEKKVREMEKKSPPYPGTRAEKPSDRADLRVARGPPKEPAELALDMARRLEELEGKLASLEGR